MPEQCAIQWCCLPANMPVPPELMFPVMLLQLPAAITKKPDVAFSLSHLDKLQSYGICQSICLVSLFVNAQMQEG